MIATLARLRPGFQLYINGRCVCVFTVCDWRCAVSNLRQVRDVYRVAAATRYSRREDASPSRFFPGNFPSETRPGLEVDHPVFLVSLSAHSNTFTFIFNRRGSRHGGISPCWRHQLSPGASALLSVSTTSRPGWACLVFAALDHAVQGMRALLSARAILS